MTRTKEEQPSPEEAAKDRRAAAWEKHDERRRLEQERAQHARAVDAGWSGDEI